MTGDRRSIHAEPVAFMNLTCLDWSVIGGYFVINLLIGLWYRKRATGSTGEFFVSGRRVAWWLAGCAMIYLVLFGTGKIIFGETLLGLGLLALAILAGVVVYRDLSR